MGVDTKAILRKGVTVLDIASFLKAKYGEVNIHSTGTEGFFYAVFDDDKDRRNLNIFTSNIAESDYKIAGTLISLGFWGNSVAIAKSLCEEYGGYLDENDCDDEDFYLINEDGYNSGSDITEYDLFMQKVIVGFGYDKLESALEIFNKYAPVKEEYKRDISEFGITPGDWIFKEQGDADEFCAVTTGGKWVIAFRLNGEQRLEEERANAKLMTAAPDLLKALLYLSDYVSRELTVVHEAEQKEIDYILQEPIAAINKAKNG